MILIKFGIQDGEREYQNWDYDRNHTYKDYNDDKITDRELLSDFFGMSLTDDDYLDETYEKYWLDTSAVWIESIMEITDQDLETLRQYGVV
jgi:Ca2+-dependent lipid-binding protein